jgi:hypothetical protein
MSIPDTRVCLLNGQYREIWLNNRRWWSRNPGNCNCNINCNIFKIQNDLNYKKKILKHTSGSSIQNVSGFRTKAEIYSYYSNKYNITKSCK